MSGPPSSPFAGGGGRDLPSTGSPNGWGGLGSSGLGGGDHKLLLPAPPSGLVKIFWDTENLSPARLHPKLLKDAIRRYLADHFIASRSSRLDVTAYYCPHPLRGMSRELVTAM